MGRSDLVLSRGDKVEIIDSMDRDWIGRKATIIRAIKYPNEPYFYQLDIGGGDWLGSCLTKI